MDAKRLHSNIRASVAADLVAKPHLGTMSDPHWTVGSDGLLRHDNHIYVPDANDLQLRVLQDKHDHVLSGHFGQGKTLDLIRCEYYWPNLWPFIVEFCKTCITCKHSKAPRHWPYSYLKQLPIPERPWDSISMDFIEQLLSSLGYTAILVIVDRLLGSKVPEDETLIHIPM